MIEIQISTGSQHGVLAFHGDEVTEPCQFDVSGDFAFEDIDAMVGMITMTAEAGAQGIYPLRGNVAQPFALIRALDMCAISVAGLPQDWVDELESMEEEHRQRLEEGDVC
ncbi:hypothetical protein [Nissabacter sp. SGAir0207]|uniref:hypothetical protein n=1 Tax=Nissabacter sp. SGAir0207 TaxID=2126321 RepID=UPI0010CD270E|nr:hypothetical protein [Nissabacter sp. SGAir0207]QCR38719.1 hypothetical protein C1N62_21520 [Nissabacter sp. SGAir0207]